jgi:hypothetical protein
MYHYTLTSNTEGWLVITEIATQKEICVMRASTLMEAAEVMKALELAARMKEIKQLGY